MDHLKARDIHLSGYHFKVVKVGTDSDNNDIYVPSVISEDFQLAVSMGLIEGYSYVDKFGENPNIDTGSVPEDVWETGGEYAYDPVGTNPIQYMSCSNTLDVGQDIDITGLDINGEEVVQRVVTDGQNNVILPTPLWRVYRAENNSNQGGDLNGIMYIHTDPNPTNGVPVAVSIRATISNGNNQTLMALYTIPKGKVAFLVRGELGVSRSQTTGAVEAAYYSRRYGKLFKVKKRVDIVNAGSSIYQDNRSFPDVIPSLTDIKLRVENVSANNAGVFGTFDILLVDEDKFTLEYLQKIGQPGY